jgi:AcrR family transcriptional regulator
MPRSIKPARAEKRPKRKLQTPNPEVRSRLTSAATELIRSKGFPNLRIEQIVERAGLSVGTFYLYFDSKADLFINLVSDFTEEISSRMRQEFEGEGTALQRIIRGLDVYLDFVEENEKGFLYFVDAADSVMTSAGRLSTWTFRVHADNIHPLLEEAMANGEIKKLDPELTAQALVGLVQHLATYWLEHRDQISRPELRAFINTFTGFGLAP